MSYNLILSFRSTTVQILKITARRFSESKSLEYRLNYSKTLLALLRDDDSDIREAAASIVTYLFNHAEEAKIRKSLKHSTYQRSIDDSFPIAEPTLSSYAQKLFLRSLSKTMLAKKFSISQAIAMLLVLMTNELDEDDEECSSEESEVSPIM